MNYKKELIKQREAFFNICESYENLLQKIKESDNLEKLKEIAEEELLMMEDWDKWVYLKIRNQNEILKLVEINYFK